MKFLSLKIISSNKSTIFSFWVKYLEGNFIFNIVKVFLSYIGISSQCFMHMYKGRALAAWSSGIVSALLELWVVRSNPARLSGGRFLERKHCFMRRISAPERPVHASFSRKSLEEKAVKKVTSIGRSVETFLAAPKSTFGHAPFRHSGRDRRPDEQGPILQSSVSTENLFG
jgi:hypothetical protein